MWPADALGAEAAEATSELESKSQTCASEAAGGTSELGSTEATEGASELEPPRRPRVSRRLISKRSNNSVVLPCSLLFSRRPRPQRAPGRAPGPAGGRRAPGARGGRGRRRVLWKTWPRGDKDALAVPAKAQNRQEAYGQGLLLSVSQRRPWRHAMPWRADSASLRSVGREAGRSSRR
ncbi:unnamed protein product [Prorocentrum cordatum]|uniref:Uncharacterized protein n=1 Tax=Prorocentrum cordatum TaxID=2364126 RepID=A0ABN9USD6_9DINO|nr:unnamed protein product [Polarella glacialis]